MPSGQAENHHSHSRAGRRKFSALLEHQNEDAGDEGTCLNVSLPDSTYEPEVMHLPKDSVSSSKLPSFYPFKIKNWTK